MRAAVMAVGLGAEAVAWWFVGVRRANVWAVMTPVLGAMGVAAILVEPPAWSPDAAPAVAAATGLASGVVLYVGTRAFVATVRPWEAFGRHSLAMYQRQGGLSLAAAALVSVLVVVPGEELFWRGLFRGELAGAIDGRLLPAGRTWSRTCRARTSRSSPARWWAGRRGPRSEPGAAACSRRSPVTPCGRRS
jgi:membrane protease YdiL (CAAX protease family)